MTDTAPLTDQQLADRIAAAIWERQNPGRSFADCESRWQADAIADAGAVLAVVQPELDRRRVSAIEREALLADARDTLEAAGQNSAHGDDWPQIAPAIRTLAVERDDARAEVDRLRADLAERTQFAVDISVDRERAKGHLAEALRILDDGPQWVNDRVMQHPSVPTARAADVLRAALAELAAGPTT